MSAADGRRQQPAMAGEKDDVSTTRTIGRIAAGLLVLAGIAAGIWYGSGQQAISQPAHVPEPTGPLIARGYTDAPAGTILVANNPTGGSVLKEMRIREGQTVKEGEIIAVLANYPMAEMAVEMAANDLATIEQRRDKILQGTRQTQIALLEDEMKSALLNDKLRDLTRKRSESPPAEREIDAKVAKMRLANQDTSLKLSKAQLAAELEQNAIDVERYKAALDDAMHVREDALVRSPINGVVTQINSRQGELAAGQGIAKIVDMSKLRVFATVDEIHLHRMKQGAPVEVTFRGDPKVYAGRIATAPLSVKREKRSEADLGVANVRQVEVEIEPADGVTFPPILGREARVIFL